MAVKGIVESTLILTVANVINRFLGFGYRIYMSNALGSEGMGLYQLIMPIYSLAWSISCSGFTTTVSKLVAGERARGNYGNMGRILKQALVITTALGIFLCVILFFTADMAALTMFKDNRLGMSLKILSLSFPFMAAGSCIRGYFMGLQETLIPAASQVFEQCIRMAVVYALSASFMSKGLAYACAAAVCGIFLGEVLSFIFVIVAYKIFKKKSKLTKSPTMAAGKTLQILLLMAMPLTFNRISGSLLSTFENMMLPQKLIAFGMSNSEAISEFGKISGMAMPLIQFPSALLVSLSMSLVPAVSESVTMKNYTKINNTVSKVMLFTTITGIGTSGIFILFSKELGQITYNQNISYILTLLGIMCPFIYMHMTLSGILNGLGEQVFIFRNSLISSAISIGFIMVIVPRIGISGYILGSFCALVIVCSLSLNKIKKTTQINIKIIDWFVKPALSALLCVLIINIIKPYIFNALGNIAALITGLIVTGLLYISLIIATGSFSKSDMKAILRKK